MDDINAHFIAQQFVFVDYTGKDERVFYRHYGPAAPGNLVRGQRYNMIAALSLDGYETFRVVPGSVNGYELFDFIVEELVREFISFTLFESHSVLQLPRMNPFPQDKSIVVLDNGILDRLGANIIREMIESQGVVLVSLAPHSPDYNRGGMFHPW
jgi:hypothetical protein